MSEMWRRPVRQLEKMGSAIKTVRLASERMEMRYDACGNYSG